MDAVTRCRYATLRAGGITSDLWRIAVRLITGTVALR